MDVVKTLKPGRNGTKHLVELYGDQLLAVRYRLDRDKKLSYITVQLIIETEPARTHGLNLTAQRLHHNRQLVSLRIRYKEQELRRLVRIAGGKLGPDKQAWYLNYGDAIRLGLKALLYITLHIDRRFPFPRQITRANLRLPSY